MSISLKIKELRKSKSMTQKEFSSIINIDDSQFSKIEQGKLQPTLNQLMEISSNFNISLDELCFENPTISLKSYVEPEIHLIPLYDGVMTASMVGNDLTPQTEPVELVNAGDWFRDATAAMRVHGDSMYPDYHSGSIVAMKEVFNKRLVIYGQDYMIETSEYRVLKRLQKSDNPECWLMCSTNTEIWEVGTQKGKLIHEPQDIHLDDVVRLYQILGSVKRNHSSRVVKV